MTETTALARQGTSLSLQVRSVDDLTRLARLFAASGLFARSANPDATLAQCSVQLLAGMEAGFTPFASITGIYVVQGRPGFSAQLLAQAIKRHPTYDYRVIEKTAEVCRIRFLAGAEELGVETFTIEMAKRAGLVKAATPWAQYPEAMLFARCLTAGMRTHCPDALGGHTAYTPEELGAQGSIDEQGMVTIYEPADRDQLQAQAIRRLKDAGITAQGMQAMLAEFGSASMGELPERTLERLARAGASEQTIQRWNADEPEEDEPPMTWTEPTVAAAAA